MKRNRNNQIPVIDQDAFNLFDIPNGTGTPERNLLMAVLERAILDYVGNTTKDIQTAEEWLFEDDEDEDTESPFGIFSFQWICQQLDLDPVKVAHTIYTMPKRGNNRTAPWYFMKAAG